MYRRCLFLLSFLLLPFIIFGQCNNWDIAKGTIVNSTCLSNGQFEIKLTGTTTDLVKIVYTIKSSGIADIVTENNIISNLSSGTYTVNASAECGSSGGSIVHAPTTLTFEIAGSYRTMNYSLSQIRPDVSNSTTKGFAWLDVLISDGSAPYTIDIVSAPSGYTGAVTFQSPNKNFRIKDLFEGAYTFKVTDNCGTSPSNASFTIVSQTLERMLNGVIFPEKLVISDNCNNITFDPYPRRMNEWNNFYDDIDFLKEFKYTAKLEGDAPIESDFKPLQDGVGGNIVTLDLAPGKTIKDYYNNVASPNIIMYARLHDATVSIRFDLNSPSIQRPIVTDCDNQYIDAWILNSPFLCYPVTATIKNDPSSPETPSYSYVKVINKEDSKTFKSDNLPKGNYLVEMVSADSYTYKGSTEIKPLATPYTFGNIVTRTRPHLNKNLDGMSLTTARSRYTNVNIKLIDGPPGYDFERIISQSQTTYTISGNKNATGLTDPTYFWAPGTYKFEVTDACGTYEVSKTLVSSYDFSLDLSGTENVCDGINLRPIAKNTITGNDVYVRMIQSPNGETKSIKSGELFELRVPGKYVFACASDGTAFTADQIGYENMMVDSIEYDRIAPNVDMTLTQGFTCINAGDNEGQLYVKGIGGVPEYTYALYQKGESATGIVIEQNTTGYFNNLTKNMEYDVKIIDACNSSSVQTVRINDLTTIQVTKPNKTSFCEGETLEFTTMVLPEATFIWTGPNGFTSTEQSPKRINLTKADAGVYSVIMTSRYCGAPNTYRIRIDVNEKPAIPLISDIETLPFIVGGGAVLTLKNAQLNHTYNVFDGSNIIASVLAINKITSVYLGKFSVDKQLSIQVGYRGCFSDNMLDFDLKFATPKVKLTDSCSFMPKLSLSIYEDVDVVWQKNVSGVWTNIGTGLYYPIKDSGEYRAEIKSTQTPTKTIYSHVIKLTVTKTKLGKATWYEVVQD